MLKEKIKALSLDNTKKIVEYDDKELENCFSTWKSLIHPKIINKLEMYTSLRHAVERGEIIVHYQPQVELKRNKVVCVEALARWQNPEKGLIEPNVFIPLAEETGLIESIGKYVLNTACRQNKEWQDEGYPPICMSVNLSVRQFQQKDLVDDIAAILKETNLDSKWLKLEITEGIAIDDVDYAIYTINSLKALGIKVELDDFGTGYSSLNYLKQLPIDGIKIDKSFIHNINKGVGEKIIAKAIIDLAHNLELTVTAEGVETSEQLSFLKKQHCDKVQGYLFSKPILPEEITRLLTEKINILLSLI